MLTGFRVHNFKAFQDTGNIELAPFTLLSGINSAGKSSLIQMLLLLKQSLESSPSQALNPSKGPFLQQSLGDNFYDFLFAHPDLSSATLTYHLAFAYDPSDNEVKLYSALNQLLDFIAVELPKRLFAEVVVRFDWRANGHLHSTVRVADLQIRLNIDENPLVGVHIQAKDEGEYEVEFDASTCSQITELNLTQIEVVDFSHFLPDSFVIYGQPTTQDVTLSLARLFHRLFAAVRRDLSESIYYLSSFRTPPLRVYTTGQTGGMVLNPNGSNFAEVLWRFREQVVPFVNPNGDELELPLRDMVARILRETLGLKQRVQVKPVAQGLDILEVKVQTLGATPALVTLPDVGLGYNQILPIIIQGLLTPHGGLVIFEQPEIHLHPEVQLRLINFFIGLARAGRWVLVETHSNLQVESLCLAIAKAHRDQLEKKVNILFVHPPDEKHPSARIEPVRINSYGEILNWPPYFLPDMASLYEETLAAGLAKQVKEEKRRKMAA